MRLRLIRIRTALNYLTFKGLLYGMLIGGFVIAASLFENTDCYIPRPVELFEPERIILAKGSLSNSRRRDFVERIGKLYSTARIIDQKRAADSNLRAPVFPVPIPSLCSVLLDLRGGFWYASCLPRAHSL